MTDENKEIKFKKGKLISGVIYPSFFPINKEDRVLNVGCGDGVQAVVYGGNFKEMVGVDINEKSLETAERLMAHYQIDNFQCVLGDVESMPINDQFDKVIAVDIIEHVIHPDLVIAEIKRLLRDNGRLLITFPAMHDKWEHFFRFVGRKILRRSGKNIIKEGWDPDQHQHNYSTGEWLALLRRGGLKLVKSRASTMFPPFHYLGIPRFWFSNKAIRTIDGFFCRLPVIKNFGQSLVGEFKKVNDSVIIAADIFEPDIGGPATYSKNLAAGLVRLGWQVKLICYSDKKQRDNYNFPVFRIIRSKFAPWHYLKYFFKLFLLARSVDIIYAMGPVSAGYPASWAAKFLGKKFVVKVVGDYAWEQAINLNLTYININKFQSEKLEGKIKKLKEIEINVCRSADKIITPSQYLKGIVKGWGIKENKIEVIYNAFNPPRQDLAIPKKEFLIISAARLVSWKGFDALIEVVDGLSKEKSDIFLEILGEGPLHLAFQNKIDNLKNNKIKLSSSLPHDVFLEKLQTARLFVLNTDYEGLSHVVLEAMSCEIPVITTNVGGNPELIKDGENGLLIEFNNKEQLKEAILKLYHEPELREKFVNNSKEVLKKFTFNEMISDTENLLKNL